MKKSDLLAAMMLVGIFCFLSTPVNAKIWRVNNRSGMAADFTTAQAAHNGSTAGDTVYFEPSATTYGDLTATKKLILVGPGYFLNENPETQANLTNAILGSVLFNKIAGLSDILNRVIYRADGAVGKRRETGAGVNRCPARALYLKRC